MASLLRRRASTQPPDLPEREARPGAKNRVTPKRSEARARRGQSVAPASGGRRSSSAQRRARSVGYRESLRSTDPASLPPRERLPERVVARDVVDSRPSTGPLLLVGLVIEVLGGFARSKVLNERLVVLLYAILLVFLVDSVVRVLRVRKAVRATVAAPTTRVGFYAVARSMLPKRWRRPVARV